MKKKFLLGSLICACLLTTAVGCDMLQFPQDPPTVDTPTVTPGTIPETGEYTDIPVDTTVEIGEFYSFDTAAIAVDGVVYKPETEVKLGAETIDAKDGYFTIEKVGEYVITYTFTVNGTVKKYTTKVTGVDTTAPTIMLEDGKINYKYRLGETVTLPTFTALDLSGDSSSPVVTVKTTDGADVTVTDGKFNIESYAGYQIMVESEDGSGNVGEKVYDIAVYQANELEYFNSEEFVKTSMKVMHGGAVTYTNDERKILEGDGAVIFSSTGKWPQLHLVDSANVDYTNVERISFWMYNNTDYSYMIDCLTLNDDFDVNATSKYLVYHQIIAPRAWTQVTASGEALRECLQQSIAAGTTKKAHITISLNGSDNDHYLDFNIIVDCIRVEYVGETHAKILTPKSVDTVTSTETGAKVQIAKASDILENLTAGEVSVTATMDGKNVSVTYDETTNAWYLPANTEGVYTVNYFYEAGENSAAATQSVTLMPAFENGDFENATSNANNLKRISVTSGTANLSFEEVTLDGKTTTALKMANETSDPYVTFNFGREYFEQMTGYQTLTFKLAFIPKSCAATATGYVLTAWDKQGGNSLFYYNTLLRGEARHSTWFEFKLSRNDLELVKETGTVTFRLWVVGATEYGYDFYVDDIGVSNATFDGSLNSTYELPDDFFGAAYGNASAKLLEVNNTPEGSDKAIRVMTSKAGANPVLTFNLGDEFVNSISVGDTFSFRLYVEKGNSSVVNIKLYMGTQMGVYDILPSNNIVAANTWVTYSIVMTQEILDSYKQSGLLYVGFNAEGADVNVGDGRSMNYFFDDFTITKA